MVKTKEHIMMDNLERQKEWVEAFKEYLPKAPKHEVESIMNKNTGILMDVLRLQALTEYLLKIKNPPLRNVDYAIMRHGNIRAKISKRYKILLR